MRYKVSQTRGTNCTLVAVMDTSYSGLPITCDVFYDNQSLDDKVLVFTNALNLAVDMNLLSS